MLNYLQDMIRYDPLRKVKYGNIPRALHIRPTAATYGARGFNPGYLRPSRVLGPLAVSFHQYADDMQAYPHDPAIMAPVLWLSGFRCS